MVCSILDGGRMRIYVTVRLLLVLLMRWRSDGMRCTLARRLRGRRSRSRRGNEGCRASCGGVARRARDRQLRDLERVHRCWAQKALQLWPTRLSCLHVSCSSHVSILLYYSTPFPPVYMEIWDVNNVFASQIFMMKAADNSQNFCAHRSSA